MHDKLHQLFDQLHEAIDTINSTEDICNQANDIISQVESDLYGALDGLHNNEHGIVEGQLNQAFRRLSSLRELL